MKKRLIFFGLFFLSISLAMAVTDYYQLGLQYTNGTIAERSVRVVPLVEEPKTPFGDYNAVILTSNNNSLFAINFSFPNQIFYESWDENTSEVNGSGTILLSNVKMNLLLPYFKNAASLLIISPEQQKLTINVSSFSVEREIPDVVSPPDVSSINKPVGDNLSQESVSTPKLSVPKQPNQVVAVAKGVGLGMGIIVLAIGLILWWKRKRE